MLLISFFRFRAAATTEQRAVLAHFNSMKRTTTDGCTAAAYIAYAFSEVATIYPITPIASMGETADKWHVKGVKNLFGSTMEVREMESELGAAGATHGALAAGALATTFTASQGLMLMIPNMYKIAGELLPGVFHVGCRSLATHALSIFGDHQDVMACRATGFAMLASASVQETHDLAIVAHVAAIKGRVPVLHFFDGWRTSNETSTIETADYDELKPLLPADAVAAFRSRAMNPEHPDLRGSAQNQDVYFQNTEARNRFYDAFPTIVQEAMDSVAAITGRHYRLFDYAGSPTARYVIVSIGSSTEVADYAIEYMNSNCGTDYGVVKVRLYRPFSAKHLLEALPPTVERIAVLDRTKEAGSLGEPLYLDVAAAIHASGRNIQVVGGRYGLGSKNFDPTMVKAVFDNLTKPEPLQGFTVGITDDVTHRSLPAGEPLHIPSAGVTSAIFYGMGSDGTVGACRTAANIIGNCEGLYSQAYFKYSAKKSGGYTVSQLRFGTAPIKQAYTIESADYVACNKSSYAGKFPLADNLAEGGTFVLNSGWTAAEMDSRLPGALRRVLAEKNCRFYNVNALAIAEAHGLGVRINMIMLAVFFKSRQVIPYDTAIARLKECVNRMYMHEGGEVVANNIAAIEEAAGAITEIDYNREAWLAAEESGDATPESAPGFITEVARPCLEMRGDSLPVSAFSPDGTLPMGTTAYEKRTIADRVPHWTAEKCVQCTECSLVCPHAAIRPYLLDSSEAASAPATMNTVAAKAPALKGLYYRIQVYPRDCTGCGSCATICPGKALEMTAIETELPRQSGFPEYLRTHVTPKEGLVSRTTVNGSQFYPPLLQFSGACAGCGETPYVKLLTQLMGERLIIANATGCSSIWGANYPSNAYCTDSRGMGPAWGNSLFEDNAEYAFGIATAISARRERLAGLVQSTAADCATSEAVKKALESWLDSRADGEGSVATSAAAIAALRADSSVPNRDALLADSDLFVKKSIWAIGGDGWAYDIGFAGLDHVLAQNVDINILVMDTECYSNTGGQTSKATPLSAMAKYSADGKRTYKKDLGRMMMVYSDVYVASIALGANFQQTINALSEADRHPGPAIVIAYCPCINHGIRAGMSHSIVEERNAVTAGYWQLYRRDPAVSQTPVVDSPAPDGKLIGFINGEDRYADLRMADPKAAAELQPLLQQRCSYIYNCLKNRL